MSKPIGIAAKFINGPPTEYDYTKLTYNELLLYKSDVQKAIDVILENGNIDYISTWMVLLDAVNLQIKLIEVIREMR